MALRRLRVGVQARAEGEDEVNRLNAMRAALRYSNELWDLLMKCDLSPEDCTAVCHDRNRILVELFGP